jgi:tRNA-splicing ligase RtcB (3'-phosphate/5'-hydroxy nucleic acid ligase)
VNKVELVSSGTEVDSITLQSNRRIEQAPAAYKLITPVIEAQVQAGLVQAVSKM